MLSFQKEQNCGALPAKKPGAAGAPGDGADKSQDQGYLTVAEHGKRTRKSTAVLAVLFIIGLLCLWFMIRKSTPTTASAAADDAEGTKLEEAIGRITGVKSEVSGRMGEIVNKFYEFSDVSQVKVNELVKNPFKFELFPSGIEEPDATGMVSQMDLELLWTQQIKQKGESLELLSIMQTDRGNCCMIDSDIFYEGDTVEGFRVREIGDDFVKLEWESKRDNSQMGGQSGSVQVILSMSSQ